MADVQPTARPIPLCPEVDCRRDGLAITPEPSIGVTERDIPDLLAEHLLALAGARTIVAEPPKRPSTPSGEGCSPLRAGRLEEGVAHRCADLLEARGHVGAEVDPQGSAPW